MCFFYSADVSEGEIVEDEGGEDSSEVAKAVEAVMVAGRHRLQGRMSRDDDDIVVYDDDEVVSDVDNHLRVSSSR